MPTTLLLARHAAHAEFGRVLSGRGDAAGLGTEGRAQAMRLARRLGRERPAALHASPRRRAIETATLLGKALGLAVVAEPALDEIDFGAWTGRTFGELEQDPAWRSWNEQRGTACPPDGEPMHEALSRALRWTGTLPANHPDAVVLAVSHADVIKAVLLAHLGASLDAHWRIEIGAASLSVLELWPGGGRVRFMNETPAGDD
ncbi:MAG TPA: histidine phosphatase family protein [Falsiroseomonas sp.]|jgi:probable phosphoglycerate mutase|nr:histidine phosphatase family protein [Falsiroseomonas sp.]